MRVLVVGCGYLGKRVVALGRQRGWQVFATTRRAERFDELRQLGAEPVQLDVLGGAGCRPWPDVDAVVYCVGLDRSAGASMRSVYVDGLDAFLSANAARGLPSTFVHVSSTGVYGQTEGGQVDETAPTEPLEESGRVVLEAEQTLLRHLPGAVRLRFAGIYGPGRLIRSKALQAGQPIVGDPDKWLNVIHVDDGARAVLAAWERGTPGCVYNVSDDRPARRREFYGLLARLLGAPEPVFTPCPPGVPPPPHERADRRVCNRRLRQELGVELRYPSFAEGLPASL